MSKKITLFAKIFSISFLFMGCGMAVFAQNKTEDENVIRCGVGLLSQSPTIFTKKTVSNVSVTASCSDTTVYQIPVVFHIIHNGEAVGIGTNIPDSRLTSQIRILNEDYRRKEGTNGYNTDSRGADARIQFVLASKDPQGKATSGIVRANGGQSEWQLSEQAALKDKSNWPKDKYLNVWVCNLKNGAENLLGFSSFPVNSDLDGLPTGADSTTDGVMVCYKYVGNSPLSTRYNLGRTLTHEIGHFLGLIHIWGDGFDCTSTDYCNDTPAASQANYNCNTTYDSCPDAQGSDMTANYLDYTYDACMNIFTQDQVARMRTVLCGSIRRKTLWSEYVPQEEPKSVSMSLYPNPVTNSNVIVAAVTDNADVTVFNAIGQKILQKTFTPTADKITINLPEYQLAEGCYFLKVVQPSQTKTFKVIVQY
ncbi:zinc-dependent metalloproteinase lipoprotein, BF0631 family [Flexibacter flexilis DSM 6793]|uniref:Zinc-dependent metalloproteinase lipoprotein, BF0631 family n=1 Tax=Flexibacter flexilis DSM 6793 TaxID=927664 RepID=A0A1I1L3V3_9BACT|nr:M43 family zinc metalloprotease [Flexibacter flexilis]SFC67767.1 zinc-dependent metalloproteinase lipoprotein, BF0631 family [Flexibacter flexilis DSM 6793]